MPVLFVKNVNPASKLALWKLDEQEEELIHLAGTRFENDPQIQKAGKRLRLQRITTRLLLKELTGSYSIEYDKNGRPAIQNSSINISLSHTNIMSAVIIDSLSETGIDLEVIHPKINHIATKFMSEKELSQLKGMGQDRINQLFVYWCAKESLYKIYGKKGLRFSVDLPVEPFDFSNDGGTLAGSIQTKDINKRVNMCYEIINGHMLVYATNP